MKRIPFAEIKDQRFDLVVIGGGLTGACIARDAALRGLKTVLLEMRDFCSGDTACGSRLLAGEGAFPIKSGERPAKSVLAELELAAQQAPHLIRPVTSLFLSAEAPGSHAFLLHEEEGGLLSWLRTPKSSIRSRVIPVRKLQSTFDYLASETLWGGYQSSDHLIPSTERLCLENLLSADQDGAALLNYARVIGIHLHNRQVFGVQAEDQITGKVFSLQTECVISACGTSNDRICTLAGQGVAEKPQVVEETYLVLPQLDNRVGLSLFLTLREQEGLRFLSLSPWHEQLIFGPSRPYQTDGTNPSPEAAHAAAGLMKDLAHLVEPGLAAKIRPVFSFSTRYALSGNGSCWNRPFRYEVTDHHRTSGPRGLISVSCPRVLLCRLAAKEAVDLAHNYIPSVKTRHESGTHTKPLFGGNIANIDEYLLEVIHAARQFQLQDRQVRHLVGLYGTKAQELFQLFRNHPELREQICPHQPDIKAQLVYAMDQEAAVTLSDIFLRRTVIGWTRCRGRDCIQQAASFLGEFSGWTSARIKAELDNFHQELGSLCRPVPPAETAREPAG